MCVDYFITTRFAVEVKRYKVKSKNPFQQVQRVNTTTINRVYTFSPAFFFSVPPKRRFFIIIFARPVSKIHSVRICTKAFSFGLTACNANSSHFSDVPQSIALRRVSIRRSIFQDLTAGRKYRFIKRKTKHTRGYKQKSNCVLRGQTSLRAKRTVY